MTAITKNRQYYQFSLYGFLKNLRFFDAFMVIFLVEKGFSFTEIGSFYAAREIAINITEVPSGIFADTYGRKGALLFSFVLYILSFVIFYFSRQYTLFMTGFLFFGIAEAFRSGTHKGMIMDYLKAHGWSAQKIDYYGHTRSWSQAGSALSALLAGVFVFYSGHYQTIFLFSTLPYFINIINVASYPSFLNRQNKAREKTSWLNTWNSFISSLKNPRVIPVIATSALHSAYLKALKDYIQIIMMAIAAALPFFTAIEPEKKEGLFIGLLYFILFLLTAFSSRLAGQLKIKNKRKTAHYTLAAGLFSGMVAGFFFQFEWWWPALLFFAFVYLIENLRKPILTGFVADETPNEILTSVLSAQSLLKTIATAVIALIFGYIADTTSIGTSLIYTSLLVFIIYLSIYFIDWKNKQINRTQL